MPLSSRSPAVAVSRRSPASPARRERVTAAIAEISALVPPVWPLEDYVAVNPFLGLAAARFLDARQLLRDVRDCELLPTASALHALYERGTIQTADLELAFRECLEAYPDCYTGTAPRQLAHTVAGLAAGGRPPAVRETGPAERRYRTASELVDERLGSSWSSHIITDITRHCSLHFDRGQAAWPSPWRHLPLYEAWRESARISRRMEMLGLTGFRRFAAELPAEPDQAAAALLEALGVPEHHWRPFLLAELFSLAGWASYLRYRLWEATLADGETIDEHVSGLLAIRLAYDAALAGLHPEVTAAPGVLFPTDATANQRPAPAEGVLGRHLFQVARESAYRRQLCRKLLSPPAASPPPPARATLQMVFCIDVRSEVFRRHLEAAGSGVETFGFAGFFGMPMEYRPLGAARGPAQCPVLVAPDFTVAESVAGEPAATAAAGDARREQRQGRRIWKRFQTSATSCFSFVETLGLASLPKLISDSFGWTRPVPLAAGDGLKRHERSLLGPDLAPLPLQRRIALAAGMLTNLGLVDRFARIVALCGHGSEMVNNPYKASYDCGACGGHSGEPNARVAAQLLNDPEVRQGLADRGIGIPADTWFVAAVHVTTTDDVRFPDPGGMPASHAEDFAAVRRWLSQAGTATRLERAERLGARVTAPAAAGRAAAALADAETESAMLRRSRDWAEVRPEWGLAGNAAFIVAARHRTAGIDLGGRVFLHDYDHARDPDGTILEMIMTGPLVVTSWINLQYYASAVDPRAFGSGNKLIHNVTGQFGVLAGNGGDLMTGLPWQAVSDGRRLVHEPVRLAVIIEAPRPAVSRVIERHRNVAELVENGWVTLLVREGDAFFRRTAGGGWQAEPGAAAGL